MPYALSEMHHDVKIATDKNESFAVLVIKNKSSRGEIMLIFTEEDGFVEAKDYKHSVAEQERAFNVPFELSALVSLF